MQTGFKEDARKSLTLLREAFNSIGCPNTVKTFQRRNDDIMKGAHDSAKFQQIEINPRTYLSDLKNILLYQR